MAKKPSWIETCHYCDKDIDTRPPKEFFSMVRNTGGSWRKRIYFHEECFEEVAGTQYFKALASPKLEIRKELVDAATVQDFREFTPMPTGSFPPYSKKLSKENEELVDDEVVSEMHRNPAKRCHYCYGEAEHITDVGDPVCKGCWDQIKGKM